MIQSLPLWKCPTQQNGDLAERFNGLVEDNSKKQDKNK